MSSIFSSFFQIAGAKSFSDFLKGDDKKTRKRTKRRSLRKTVAQRKSRRKGVRRTARRSSRRTARRSSRRTSKFIKARNLTKRKRKGVPGKYECVGCDKSKKAYYTGEEPSPKGLGYCARCTPLNVMMKGKDGNLWENKSIQKGNVGSVFNLSLCKINNMDFVIKHFLM